MKGKLTRGQRMKREILGIGKGLISAPFYQISFGFFVFLVNKSHMAVSVHLANTYMLKTRRCR